jgi:hypothetical protein
VEAGAACGRGDRVVDRRDVGVFIWETDTEGAAGPQRLRLLRGAQGRQPVPLAKSSKVRAPSSTLLDSLEAGETSWKFYCARWQFHFN